MKSELVGVYLLVFGNFASIERFCGTVIVLRIFEVVSGNANW